MTKDCQLICRREPDLVATTDAKTKFPELVRNYTIDSTLSGRGVLSSDLTLAQVRNLSAVQRLPAIRSDAQSGFSGKVPTLQEYLDLVKGNADRVVGIYPETKHPTWHDRLQLPCTNGTPFSTLLLQALEANNYTGPYNSPAWLEQPVFIQSFEVGNLKALKIETDIPLVQLLDAPTTVIPGEPTNRTYGNLTTEAGLDELATYASGMGPDKQVYILNISDAGYYYNSTDLIARAHRRGIQLHPYTFRNEYQFMATNFSADIYNEYDVVYGQLGLDGAFTDFPETQHNYLECRSNINASNPTSNPNATILVSADSPGGPVNASESLPSDRPWIIAHGGASGPLPGNTLEAFQRAIAVGANFITCEVVVTRDQQLICQPSPNLANSTDARTMFANLTRTASLGGQNISGIFASDLTLAQVKTLTVNQTTGTGRDQSYNGQLQVATLREALATARNASRVVGVYIDIVQPAFHNAIALAEEGPLQEDLVLNAINSTGGLPALCSNEWNQNPILVASLSQASLEYIHDKAAVPLVQKLNANETSTLQEAYVVDRLANISSYAAAISPDKALLVPNNNLNYTSQPTQLAQRAHRLGMMVFPFLFRNENQFLLYTFGADPHRELDYYITNLGIDGAITDYPATMSTTLNCKLQDPEGGLEPILLPDACSASKFAPTSK
ncbi:hypothetical protein ABBQ32_013480 [Trebouxia sp. C0010 RCD-2024]